MPYVWANRLVPVAELRGFAIKEPQLGGIEVLVTGGRSFYVKLPVGIGAFSSRDLEWMKTQWTRDVGLATKL